MTHYEILPLSGDASKMWINVAWGAIGVQVHNGIVEFKIKVCGSAHRMLVNNVWVPYEGDCIFTDVIKVQVY